MIISATIDWIKAIEQYEDTQDMLMNEGIDFHLHNFKSEVITFIRSQYELDDNWSDFTEFIEPEGDFPF